MTLGTEEIVISITFLRKPRFVQVGRTRFTPVQQRNPP